MTDAPQAAAPLAGLTVLELASWVAAPSCGALLADLGAEVVKVEPPTGDGMRGSLRPPRVAAGTPTTDYPFQLDNRGKRSVAVDLTDDRGAALVAELAGHADVLLTNLLPARLARFGLDPEPLRAVNPRLVYARVSGLGSRGPEADRAGFDLTAFFGRAGIMSLVGEPDEPPPAFRPGQGDHPTGLALLSAILAALLHRERTGTGQVVETSLLRVGAWSIGSDLASALVDGRQPTARGRREPFSPLNTRYRCGDGTWIILSAHDQAVWPRLCAQLGRPELAEAPYDTPAKRFRRGPELVDALDEVLGAAPLAHWAPRLDAAGVAWDRVADLPELIADPQARANGLFTTVEHPEVGPFETLAAPFELADADVDVRGPAPEPGQDTAAVLARFDVSPQRVAELTAAGIVGPPAGG